MMQELKTYELSKIAGGGFSLSGGGGGNFGKHIGGTVGITYTPEKGGVGFSYSHSLFHVNGVGTFSRPQFFGITFTKKW